MAGKPKKKETVPAKEEIIDDDVQTEETVEGLIDETDDDVTVPKDNAKSKKGDAEPKKKTKKGGFKLSSIDPILLVSFTIFMVSCLIVTGVTVYGIVAGDSSDRVCEYGDNVKVDYTGSFFGYYDENGITVFDTSMQSVGDSDEYAKSYEYTKKDSYSPLEFAAGQGSYLEDFRDAVIGHRPGDTIKVEIVDGYGSLTVDENKFTCAKAGNTVSKVVTGLTVDKYKELFKTDDVPDKGNTSYGVTTPYGWKADVTHESNDTISIDNLAADGETYTVSDGFSIKVNTVGATINFDYVIDDFAENSKMIRALYDGNLVYIISSSGTDMTYKTTNEKTGITLYFVIKFLEYSE